MWKQVTPTQTKYLRPFGNDFRENKVYVVGGRAFREGSCGLQGGRVQSNNERPSVELNLRGQEKDVDVTARAAPRAAAHRYSVI